MCFILDRTFPHPHPHTHTFTDTLNKYRMSLFLLDWMGVTADEGLMRTSPLLEPAPTSEKDSFLDFYE
jgi:hypothetical protein